VPRRSSQVKADHFDRGPKTGEIGGSVVPFTQRAQGMVEEPKNRL
jgi:hypothetical protein